MVVTRGSCGTFHCSEPRRLRAGEQRAAARPVCQARAAAGYRRGEPLREKGKQKKEKGTRRLLRWPLGDVARTRTYAALAAGGTLAEAFAPRQAVAAAPTSIMIDQPAAWMIIKAPACLPACLAGHFARQSVHGRRSCDGAVESQNRSIACIACMPAGAQPRSRIKSRPPKVTTRTPRSVPVVPEGTAPS